MSEVNRIHAEGLLELQFIFDPERNQCFFILLLKARRKREKFYFIVYSLF